MPALLQAFLRLVPLKRSASRIESLIDADPGPDTGPARLAGNRIFT